MKKLKIIFQNPLAYFYIYVKIAIDKGKRKVKRQKERPKEGLERKPGEKAEFQNRSKMCEKPVGKAE